MSETDDAARVRAIIEVMRECNERPTFGAVAGQFRYETGRALPEVWKRTPPAWLRKRLVSAEDTSAAPVASVAPERAPRQRRLAQDESTPPARLGRKD